MRGCPVFVSASLFAFVAGCSSLFGADKQDGSPMGVYHVTAQVDPTSTCIEQATQAPNPWTFDVTLRRDGTVGYWYASGATDPVVGTIDGKGGFQFQATASVQVHGAVPSQQLGACTIDRTDQFVGALVDTSATPASFTGTIYYSYVVEDGSDCHDVVGAVSDDRPAPLFSTIPCQVRFTYTATRTGDAPK